ELMIRPSVQILCVAAPLFGACGQSGTTSTANSDRADTATSSPSNPDDAKLLFTLAQQVAESSAQNPLRCTIDVPGTNNRLTHAPYQLTFKPIARYQGESDFSLLFKNDQENWTSHSIFVTYIPTVEPKLTRNEGTDGTELQYEFRGSFFDD